jgi:hypothetical protein
MKFLHSLTLLVVIGATVFSSYLYYNSNKTVQTEIQVLQTKVDQLTTELNTVKSTVELNEKIKQDQMAAQQLAPEGCVIEPVVSQGWTLDTWTCDRNGSTTKTTATSNGFMSNINNQKQQLVDILPIPAGSTAQKVIESFIPNPNPNNCAVVLDTRTELPNSVVQRYNIQPSGALGFDEDITPCGDNGVTNGIQYFEVHPNTNSVLFVRIGQDAPPFNADSFQFISL